MMNFYDWIISGYTQDVVYHDIVSDILLLLAKFLMVWLLHVSTVPLCSRRIIVSGSCRYNHHSTDACQVHHECIQLLW